MDEVLKLLREISGKLDGIAAGQTALAQHAQATASFHATLGASLAEIPRRLTSIEKVLDEATRPPVQA
jgi:hypothetical protein